MSAETEKILRSRAQCPGRVRRQHGRGTPLFRCKGAFLARALIAILARQADTVKREQSGTDCAGAQPGSRRRIEITWLSCRGSG